MASTSWAKELPGLQLRLLSPLPEAGLYEVLHVLPPDTLEGEAQGTRRHVAADGHIDWLAMSATGAGSAILSAP